MNHEATKFIAIAGFIWTVFQFVMLPLNGISYDIRDMKSDIAEIKGYKSDIDKNSKAITVINTTLKIKDND